jgi:hypothetical protein
MATEQSLSSFGSTKRKCTFVWYRASRQRIRGLVGATRHGVVGNRKAKSPDARTGTRERFNFDLKLARRERRERTHAFKNRKRRPPKNPNGSSEPPATRQVYSVEAADNVT